MAKTYYTVLTTYGSQLFAQAMANRQQVSITQFAVGDGNGRAVQPDSTRTSLVREVHRANISAVSTDPRNNKQVIFELTIPENVGGFWIREMGIYDANHRLVAYANSPDTYKPQLSEGSGKVQVMRMILRVSSSDAVTLSIDDSVIFVTRGQLTPKTITATSQNGVDETGHTHAIAHASTTQKGIVQTTSDTGADSETLAFNAKGAKKLAQQIAQNQQAIAGLNSSKVDKTAMSNSVSSTSQTNVASSQAVKTAYDKGVEAKNAAEAAQRTANDGVNKANNANNNANTRMPIHGDVETTGTKTFAYQIRLKSNEQNSDKYARFGQNGTDSFIQNPYSQKYLQLRNNGRLQYDGQDVFVKGLQNPHWDDVAGKPNASTTRRGLAQYTDNVNFDSSDWGASAKALRTVNLKAEAAQTAANNAQRTANDGVNRANNAQTSANNANNNANGRVSKAGDTMTGHLQIKDGDWSSVRLFNSQQKCLILEVQPDTQGGSFGALIYRDAQERNLAHLGIPQKNGTLALADETVNKAGDTMTNALRINASSGWANLQLGTKQGVWRLEVNPDSHLATDRRFNFLYQEGNQSHYLRFPNIGSGEIVAYQSWVESHYTARTGGYAQVQTDHYGGLAIDRPSRHDKMLMESNGDRFAFIRRNRQNNENHYAIYLPEKNGTVMLEGDFASKAKSLVSRRDYNRTISGTASGQTNNKMQVDGSVHIFPDGRILQIFHLKHFRDFWFDWEDNSVGFGGGERGRHIPLQLWTAMPHNVLAVHPQLIRATHATQSHFYGAEAGEFACAWAFRKQGNSKDRITIDLSRFRGGESEYIDLYVVVEGY